MSLKPTIPSEITTVDIEIAAIAMMTDVALQDADLLDELIQLANNLPDLDKTL